jgi:hypothetical protein
VVPPRPFPPMTASPLWTRLRCSPCGYVREHPGPIEPGDLDGACALCLTPWVAVSTFRVCHGGNPP